MPFRTNVYVDAFNVYYGSTKGTPYHWLNLARLCEIMLANNVINQIKVFTGIVKPRPNDQQQPVRQQAYLRALRTIPNLTIIEGSFLTHPRSFPKSKPRCDGSLEYVEVLYTEEHPVSGWPPYPQALAAFPLFSLPGQLHLAGYPCPCFLDPSTSPSPCLAHCYLARLAP